MQLELTNEQMEIVEDLVESRIREIHPEIRRSRVHTVHDELKQDLETLRDLLAYLKEVGKNDQMRAWQGYVESRKVPSNPPPGRGPF